MKEEHPFDLETTSFGLTILRGDREIAHSVINEMLEYVDAEGIIQLYFDKQRPRVDPITCTNILALFYLYGRGTELQHTLNWVHQVLLTRAYLNGTRYYNSPECFLYFISRLLRISGDPDLHSLLKPLLKERIQERIGAAGDSLALAMRILVCDLVGMKNPVDLETLLTLQCEDGGWEMGWFYKHGWSGMTIGNRGLTTALAIKAIEAMDPQPTIDAFVSGDQVTIVPTSPKRWSLLQGKRLRAGSFRNSLQSLWPQGGKPRKSIDRP